jgi:hypothetical protein
VVGLNQDIREFTKYPRLYALPYSLPSIESFQGETTTGFFIPKNLDITSQTMSDEG